MHHRFLRHLVSLAALVAIALWAMGLGAAWAQGKRSLRLVALGDSLTAGYGLSPGAAYPAVLQAALRAKGYDVTIINAGVNGDTASGGYQRVDGSVPDGTDGVIVELGGNDMLQNVDPSVTRNALTGIVARLRQRGIPVMLAGVRSLSNRSVGYVSRFEGIYPALARSYSLVLYSNFLQGVYGNRSLTQADGIHPNAAGVQQMVRASLPSVERFVSKL